MPGRKSQYLCASTGPPFIGCAGLEWLKERMNDNEELRGIMGQSAL